MKQSQTFKFDPLLIKELKREAKKNNRPFNNYVEHLLKTRKTDSRIVLIKDINNALQKH